MTLPAIVPPPGVHDTNVLLPMCSVYVPFGTGQDMSTLVVVTVAHRRRLTQTGSSETSADGQLIVS
jgi:hypothetical protein